MPISDRRLRLGRLQVYIEPRDIWVGVYVDPKAIYICPLPIVVLRWDRHQHDPIECGCELRPSDMPESHPFFDRCEHGTQFLDECERCPGGNPFISKPSGGAS